jgi:hypothetical protein
MSCHTLHTMIITKRNSFIESNARSHPEAVYEHGLRYLRPLLLWHGIAKKLSTKVSSQLCRQPFLRQATSSTIYRRMNAMGAHITSKGCDRAARLQPLQISCTITGPTTTHNHLHWLSHIFTRCETSSGERNSLWHTTDCHIAFCTM